MRLAFGVMILAGLSACGTPQERCINSAAREYRTLSALRDEVQANLDRGYALEDYEITRTEWVRCEDEYTRVHVRDAQGNEIVEERRVPSNRMCLEDITDTVTRRVPIDPSAEKRKLAGLQARLKQEGRLVEAAVQSCKLQHPE